MPQVLAPIIGAGLSALGITGAAASIVGNLVIAGLALGANYAVGEWTRRKAKRADRPTRQQYTQNVRAPLQARFRSYGTVKVGGVVFFAEVSKGDLYIGIAQGSGTISGVKEWRLDGRVVYVKSTAVANLPFFIRSSGPVSGQSWAFIENRRGTATQTASSLLRTAFPSQWSTSHRLNGIPCTFLRFRSPPLEDFQKIFNSAVPQLTCIQESAVVHNPSIPTSAAEDPNSWQFTELAAPIVLDFIRFHMGIGLEAINLPSFGTATAVCAELVSLKTGGAERRYRLCGSYSFDEEPQGVLQGMLDACDGRIYLTPNGEYGLRCGNRLAPSVTIGPDQIIEMQQIQRGSGALARFNAVRPTFNSPAHDYTDQEAATQALPNAAARDGRIDAEDLYLPWCPSHAQAQRVAKRALYEQNPLWSGRVLCTIEALDLLHEESFTLDYPLFGINATALIDGISLADDLSSVTVQFRIVDAAAEEWVPEIDEGAPPVVPEPTESDPLSPAAPTNVQVVVEKVATTVRAGIRWTPPGNAGEVYDLRWRLIGDDWTTQTGITNVGSVTSDLVENGNYEAEVRVRTTQGGISPWGPFAFTATAVAIPSLLAPTAISAEAGQEEITITVTHSTSAGAFFLQWTQTSGTAAADWAAAQPPVVVYPGEVFTRTVASPAGTRRVHARAYSPQAAVFSSAVTSASVSVTSVPVTPPTGNTGGGSSNDNDSGGATGGSGNTSGGASDPQPGDLY